MDVPKLNVPGWEPRLQDFLDKVKSRILDIERKTGIDPSSSSETDFGDDSVGFSLTLDGPEVLAGTGEVVSTEDAWTTISAGVPEEATIGYIQFYMFSNDDDAGGTITFRSDDGDPEIVAAIVRADGTSDADRASIAAYFIPLTDGSFDYKADTTSGDAEWSIRRIGYL